MGSGSGIGTGWGSGSGSGVGSLGAVSIGSAVFAGISTAGAGGAAGVIGLGRGAGAFGIGAAGIGIASTVGIASIGSGVGGSGIGSTIGAGGCAASSLVIRIAFGGGDIAFGAGDIAFGAGDIAPGGMLFDVSEDSGIVEDPDDDPSVCGSEGACGSLGAGANDRSIIVGGCDCNRILTGA